MPLAKAEVFRTHSSREAKCQRAHLQWRGRGVICQGYFEVQSRLVTQLTIGRRQCGATTAAEIMSSRTRGFLADDFMD